MTIAVTSFLVQLIHAIENVRMCESERWSKSEHFLKLESCLEDAQELLHSTSTPENKLQTIIRRAARHSTAKRIKTKRIYLPDEVLNIIFSYFKDTFDYPTNLSSNAYNFCLVSKSWLRVANKRLWENVHLSSKTMANLFARSLCERHQSPTRQKGSTLSIGDGIRGLHIHYDAEITLSASVTYVLDCVNLFTKNIVSLNLKGLSTDERPLKLTEFYEIIRFHPHLKHVWLRQVDLDSVEPVDPLPQLETCDCRFWQLGRRVETLELISAKTISFANINVFKRDAVKSVFCDYFPLFQRQVHEYKQLTHFHLHRIDDYGGQTNALMENFNRIVRMPLLSFLVLDKLSSLTSSSFDLITEHCSLTTFVIKWQPSEDSVYSWVALIRKLGPNLLSMGVGLERDKYLDHPNIFQAIYQNCPNLRTLELYGNISPNDAWPFQLYTSELENLCRLPLKWIYAPWFQKWPQHWKDCCPKFTKLCRLGLDIGLDDLPCGVSQLLDYNQPMRPAIVGDGFSI